VSRSKATGTAAETAVVNYLRKKGFVHAERRALQGSRDTGDINLGDPSVVIEVKAEKSMTLAQYIDETETEGGNAGACVAVCWHKRRGKGSPGEWYVTMTGERFIELLKDHCGIEVAP
jgi:hypothetical protein